MEKLKRKVRATVPALLYALGFMVVLILMAVFSEIIRAVPMMGTLMTTALVVFYVLAIYFLFKTAADIRTESKKAALFSWFWFVAANICIMYVAGSSFVGALNKTSFEDIEIANIYNILMGWIVATHISKAVSTHLFDIMVGMMGWLVIFSLFFSVSSGIIPNIGADHIYVLGAVVVFSLAYLIVLYLEKCMLCGGKENRRKRGRRK